MSRDNLEKMEDGRQAAVVDSLVRPLINERVSSYVQLMCAYYRGGQLSHDLMLGKVAEITALLDLLSGLEAAQRIGDTAAQKELGNAETRR